MRKNLKRRVQLSESHEDGDTVLRIVVHRGGQRHVCGRRVGELERAFDPDARLTALRLLVREWRRYRRGLPRNPDAFALRFSRDR